MNLFNLLEQILVDYNILRRIILICVLRYKETILVHALIKIDFKRPTHTHTHTHTPSHTRLAFLLINLFRAIICYGK